MYYKKLLSLVIIFDAEFCMRRREKLIIIDLQFD